MKLKSTLSILFLSALLLTSCGTDIQSDIQTEIEPQIDTQEDGMYTIMSLNVHDWVNPEESAETINKVIDLHEEYEIPIGIYMTDPVFQNYVEMDDPLLDRLVESEYVEIAYHFRPPFPAYSGFDNDDIAKMNDEDRYNSLMEYETHALDLVTGQPSEAPGGIEFLKDTLGEAPMIASLGSAVGNTRTTLAQIYSEMGVLFTVGRNGIDVGSTEDDLWIRPEHYDLKLYEHVNRFNKNNVSIEEILSDAVDSLIVAENGPEVLGIKYHENNFYLTGTPFAPCMWEDGNKQVPLEPPYDLGLCYNGEDLRPLSAQKEHWALYEATLEYIDDHRAEFNPIGLEDVLEMMQ